MKKRSLLTVVVMLSIFVFGIGSAYAVLGVNDAVPGSSVVIPFFCEKNGTLNTNWAIAEKDDGAAMAGGTDVVVGHLFIYDRKSNFVYDKPVSWTKRDVVVEDCKSLVAEMQGTADLIEVNDIKAGSTSANSVSKTMYVGYAELVVDAENETFPNDDRFIPWVYIVDIANGFSAGFNGVSAEFGLGQKMGEDGDLAPVTAHSLFPRYILQDPDPDSYTWWIILAGRNDINTIDPALNVHRSLVCNVCDEEEHCPSFSYPIPYELNIVNVADKAVPGVNGFALCQISETGTYLGSQVTITGTIDPELVSTGPNTYYSLYGWAYQRVAAGISSPVNIASANEIHRLYCDLCECPAPEGHCNFNPGTICANDSECTAANDFCVFPTVPVCGGTCTRPNINADTDLGLGIYLDYVTGDTTAGCSASGNLPD